MFIEHYQSCYPVYQKDTRKMLERLFEIKQTPSFNSKNFEKTFGLKLPSQINLTVNKEGNLKIFKGGVQIEIFPLDVNNKSLFMDL